MHIRDRYHPPSVRRPPGDAPGWWVPLTSASAPSFAILALPAHVPCRHVPRCSTCAQTCTHTLLSTHAAHILQTRAHEVQYMCIDMHTYITQHLRDTCPADTCPRGAVHVHRHAHIHLSTYATHILQTRAHEVQYMCIGMHTYTTQHALRTCPADTCPGAVHVHRHAHIHHS